MRFQCRVEHCRDVGHDVLDFVDPIVDHPSQSSLSHVNSRRPYVAASQTDVCLGASFRTIATPSLASVTIMSASFSSSTIGFILPTHLPSAKSRIPGRRYREQWRKRYADAHNRPITNRLCISIRNVGRRIPAQRDTTLEVMICIVNLYFVG